MGAARENDISTCVAIRPAISSAPTTRMPRAEPNVARGRMRSAGRGAAAEYGDPWVIVVRVDGQTLAPSSAGHPVGAARYVAGASST